MPNAFDALETSLSHDGPAAALDQLAASLKAEKKYPQLFEARLMKKRLELGLPLQGADVFRDLPEALQAQVEDYYVEVCREVGGLFLESGDIAGAWPYFRAIDEPKKVAEALDEWQPPPGDTPSTFEAPNGLDSMIDIALHQGANPRRGYDLLLAHHGVCRAITVLEHQFPHSGEVKEECGELLVRRLHADLVAGLKHDIQRREGSAPAEDDVKKLIENRPGLFEGYGYHVDVSHLQSAIRIAASLRRKPVLELAIQLAEYGRRLPRDFQSNDRPPFDDFHTDYRIFLQALVGVGVDGAVRYFTQKADKAAPDDEGRHFSGEILVHLLYRTGRYGEAIQAFLKYLRSFRGPLSAAPSLFELCDRAGDFTKLLELAKERDDPLQYAAGLIRSGGARTPD